MEGYAIQPFQPIQVQQQPVQGQQQPIRMGFPEGVTMAMLQQQQHNLSLQHRDVSRAIWAIGTISKIQENRDTFGTLEGPPPKKTRPGNLVGAMSGLMEPKVY